MKTKFCITAAALAACLSTPAMAQDASAVDVSVGLSAATDYVWRGVSQSDEDPAVFATVQVTAGGFYAGAGTENVDFAGVKQEYDLWAGYVLPLGGTTKLDVGVVRYGYVDAGADIDTLEIKGALSTSVGQTGLGLATYWTPDYFGTDKSAIYTELTASHPLMDKLTLSGAVGYQSINNSNADYVNWNAGLKYEVLPGASVDVRYHDTDEAGDVFGSRIVGSFAIGF